MCTEASPRLQKTQLLWRQTVLTVHPGSRPGSALLPTIPERCMPVPFPDTRAADLLAPGRTASTLLAHSERPGSPRCYSRRENLRVLRTSAGPREPPGEGTGALPAETLQGRAYRASCLLSRRMLLAELEKPKCPPVNCHDVTRMDPGPQGARTHPRTVCGSPICGKEWASGIHLQSLLVSHSGRSLLQGER